MMQTEQSKVAGKVDEEKIVMDNTCQQNSPNSSTPFICQFCEKTFSLRANLYRHYRRLHKHHIYTSREKMKCPFPTCNFSCSFRRQLRIHLSKPDTHNITFHCYKRTFKCVEDFLEWKAAEEQKTRTLFVKVTNTQPGRSKAPPGYYKCHRSGRYTKCNIGVDGQGRMSKKTKETKKINATCPASMNIRVTAGRVNLIYHKTHVGHGDEWQHQRLSKAEKDYIANKLLQGFSFDKILNDIRNDDTLAGQRIRMVTKKDLHNIMKSYGVKWDEEEVYSDLKNTDTWVQQLKDFSFSPVLFYKPRGIAMNNKHSLFHKKDFMLSIVTEGQKQMFEMLPASAFGIYSSLESNSHHFFLITFFVVDADGLPFPLAYCLTSRTDDKAIKAFLNALKDKFGTVRASMFISDTVWHSAWTEVMGLPNKHIMYFPHTKHNWKKNLCKASGDTEKQEKIYNLLVDLSTEADCSKFELLLKSFVDQVEHIDDLKEFDTHFKNNFLNNTHMWALCYYADAGLPTVAHLEEMHKGIHNACFYEGTPKSVDLCIRELLLLTHRYFYEQLSKIYRETDFIEQAIILNHRNNEQSHSFEIECDENSAKWKIRTSDDESVYCVKKRDSECPEGMLLYCPLCQVFLDMYTCNCVDYLIMCTMCEHVHAITRLLKECQGITDNTSEEGVAQLLEVDYETIPYETIDCVESVESGGLEENLIALVQV